MLHVLLIEDELRLRENLSELLEIHNFEVTIAENGLNGLEKLNLITPNIILCDIMMPVLNGYQFLEELNKKEQKKNIPVILISAKIEPEDINLGLALGAVDYLRKPFKISDLVDKINNVLVKL